MNFKLNKYSKYDLIAPTSMGVRITPDNRQPVHTSERFFMQATSAETNCMSILAALGLNTKALTTFVKGSPIARFIKRDLSARGIEFEGPELEQNGPWGYRHQFNIADSGFSLRGPMVYNDRAGEVGRTLNTKDFDVERIFGTDGARILHISGLVAALSEMTGEFCLSLARLARLNGTLVSFDLNHRTSFWEGREDELHALFNELAKHSDILIGNKEAFQLCLRLKGPETGGKELPSELDACKAMINRAKSAYPNAMMFATTLRRVISANEHEWGAILLDGDDWHTEPLRAVPVLDRIGGGDGFAGGLLYGVLKEFSADDALRFGWACGVLAASVLTDYACPADEAQIWSIYQGDARVKR